jgi:hypothetical protein
VATTWGGPQPWGGPQTWGGDGGIAAIAARAAIPRPRVLADSAPVARVQVEFTAGVWTDLTSRWDAAQPVSITVGRSDTDEAPQPGRLSGLVLDNTDGALTVGNTASPYAPNVTSGKRIRLSILDDTTGAWSHRFTGRVEGWPLRWADNGTTCWVDVSATDALNDWAVATLPSDYMLRQARQDSGLLAYWAATSLTPAGTLPSWGGGPMRNAGSAPTTLTGPGLPGDPSPTLEFALGTGGYYLGSCPAMSADDWTLAAWFRVTEEPAAGITYGTLRLYLGADYDYGVALRVKADGCYASVRTAGVWADRIGPVAPGIADGSWHHVVLTHRTTGPTLTLAVDDEGGNALGMSGAPSTTIRTVAIGSMAGGVAHISLRDLSIARTHAALAAPAAGLVSRSVSARMAEIATLAGLSAPTVVGTPRPTLAAAAPFGTALELAQAVLDTDGGTLHCSGDGTVVYRAGSTATTGALALELTAEDIGPDLVVQADRTHVANEITVTNTAPLGPFSPDPSTTVTTWEDAASIAAMGRRPRELSTAWNPDQTTDQGYLASRAATLLRTVETPRIPTLTTDAYTAPAARQSAILAASVWDRIAVTDLPTAGGLPPAWLGRIEGWTETIGVDTWSLAYTCSAAGNQLDDETLGELPLALG